MFLARGVIIFGMLLGSLVAGAVDIEKNILGSWSYAGFIYEEQRYPKPNPNLFLTFTFKESGLVQLYWKRANEEYFCDRTAEWRVIERDYLYQHVMWVNPENHSSCSQDKDMQLGRKTKNQVMFVGEEMHLVLELNGKPFYYVLKRLN